MTEAPVPQPKLYFMTISRLRFFTDGNLKEDTMPETSLGSPEQILDYWIDHIQTDPTLEFRKELLVVIPLTARLQPVGHTVISVGTSNETLCHPVEVLRPVLLSGYPRFLLLHNHPSGRCTPSMADIRQTKRIVEAAEMLQIRLIDHAIVGTPPGRPLSIYSMQEGGQL